VQRVRSPPNTIIPVVCRAGGCGVRRG
jgi:hypothetical protein